MYAEAVCEDEVMSTEEYDAVVTTEETISAEEFLKRRKAGEISPERVKIALPRPGLPFGGFKVKLDIPIYKVPFGKEREKCL